MKKAFIDLFLLFLVFVTFICAQNDVLPRDLEGLNLGDTFDKPQDGYTLTESKSENPDYAHYSKHKSVRGVGMDFTLSMYSISTYKGKIYFLSELTSRTGSALSFEWFENFHKKYKKYVKKEKKNKVKGKTVIDRTYEDKQTKITISLTKAESSIEANAYLFVVEDIEISSKVKSSKK